MGFSSDPRVIPTMRETTATDRLIIEAFAKIDGTALGLAVGSVGGLSVFLATIILVFKGGEVVGPNLALLGQFFIGYTVTTKGAFIGVVYGFIAGFLLGWLIGFFRNLLMSGYIRVLRTRATLTSSLDSID
jgi:hypothetical protein